MEQIVIIGTGCAGLTAAIYAARSNLSPLVLTDLMPARFLTTTSTVDNYPVFPEDIDGYELMVRMQKQAEPFGACIKVLHALEDYTRVDDTGSRTTPPTLWKTLDFSP
jgi:thioredoxin reductase (NADPH)